MGTLTGANIIQRANDVLNQTAPRVFWVEDELLRYLSDGQREAVVLKPDINPDLREVALVAGTKQVLPADAWSLLDVVRNIDGAAPGKVIEMIDRRVIDRSVPSWHSAAATDEVRYAVYDMARDRRTWWVYPQQPAAPKAADIVVAKIPVELATTATTIELDDTYQPALLAYMLHMAYTKELAAEGQGGAKSTAWYRKFLLALGLQAPEMNG